MEFSGKRLAEVLQGLAPSQAVGKGADKRRAPRVDNRARLRMLPCPRQQPVTIQMRDVSARGVRFIHSDAMRTGDQFVLYLPRSDGKTVAVLCTAVHCRSEASQFSIGAEFTCVLPEDPAASTLRAAPATDAQQVQRIRASVLGN